MRSVLDMRNEADSVVRLDDALKEGGKGGGGGGKRRVRMVTNKLIAKGWRQDGSQ